MFLRVYKIAAWQFLIHSSPFDRFEHLTSQNKGRGLYHQTITISSICPLESAFYIRARCPTLSLQYELSGLNNLAVVIIKSYIKLAWLTVSRHFFGWKTPSITKPSISHWPPPSSTISLLLDGSSFLNNCIKTHELVQTKLKCPEYILVLLQKIKPGGKNCNQVPPLCQNIQSKIESGQHLTFQMYNYWELCFTSASTLIPRSMLVLV